MATTKIWPIRGWIGKAIQYVKNLEKTDGAKHPEVFASASESLSNVIAYATRPDKTQTTDRIFVSGLHCEPATAREEMQAVQPKYDTKNSPVAYHAYQSFAPGEVTPEQAHEIGKQLVDELWGDRFQVVIATHLDKQHHLHNHFLINAVSYVDGLRFLDNMHTYTLLRECSDRLCREHNLSVIENPVWGKSKHYGEYRADHEGRATWRSLVKADVDEAIHAAYTEQDFFKLLRAKGYEIKSGKDISVRPPGKPRFLRLAHNFGEAYTLDGIREQILAHGYQPMPVPKKMVAVSYYPQSNPFKLKKSHGFQGLYLHYCYLLGVFPEKPLSSGQQHFLLREDILKMEQISLEAQLLGENNIDTLAQLVSYRNELQAQMQAVTKERQSLRYQQRSIQNPVQKEAARQSVSDLNEQLLHLRKKIAACDSIETRSVGLAEKLRIMEESEPPETNTKEPKHDEHRW